MRTRRCLPVFAQGILPSSRRRTRYWRETLIRGLPRRDFLRGRNHRHGVAAREHLRHTGEEVEHGLGDRDAFARRPGELTARPPRLRVGEPTEGLRQRDNRGPLILGHDDGRHATDAFLEKLGRRHGPGPLS